MCGCGLDGSERYGAFVCLFVCLFVCCPPQVREIMQPYLKSDGHYLLRPSGDNKGGVLCTICVT